MSGLEMWKMELNKTYKIDNCLWEITRVPGGWIYSPSDGRIVTTAVFVPLDNEFVKI